MSISMFDSRVMLAALEQRTPPTLFLRDTFFRNTKTFDTDTVDIDIVQGKRRVAAYQSPLDEGKIVTRDGFSTFTYKPPYLKPKMVTTAADLLKRSASETVYTAMSPAARMAKQISDDTNNLDDMISRAEEVQCAQAIFTGTVTLRDAANALTFPMKASHQVTLSGSNLWTDTANSNPLAKLREFKRLIQQDSGLNPTKAVFGRAALDAFLVHPKVTANSGALSSVKTDLGQISPALLPGGVTYWGYLKDPGIDIYTYDGWYRDAADVEQELVPSNKIALIADGARFDRLYGVIQDLGALYAVPRFPSSWEERDPSVRMLMLQSAPLMVPHQVDGYLFATVV